jgi:hypothetical protein
MDSVGELVQRHNLERKELGAFLGWSNVTLSRKLNNRRPWTYDEVDRAARWFRLHGVPIGPPELRILIGRVT